MPDLALSHRRFSFQRRPTPVPGDLRIAWRLALILAMLGCSRSNRASLAKLHILNDAVRSNQHQRLKTALEGDQRDLAWGFRVEPAFARAIDFVVGEKLATWTKATGRAALQLTKDGVVAAASVMDLEDALVAERAIISDLAKSITEGTITDLLGEGRKT
ncbi:MAG: hypothetical protein E5W91_32060 [Mesorhizobium sp.]|uniref:hypothetical protein n=1 Tax=Mesorhizobium sp. TaxID=1871066 RepID=UPI0012258BA2|nr:hypothetical protein [Mesorhizobium sp.]TIS53200.1 MAG: hypothetical protein E5W91_32060 [Mesorhizobium sp.]